MHQHIPGTLQDDRYKKEQAAAIMYMYSKAPPSERGNQRINAIHPPPECHVHGVSNLQLLSLKCPIQLIQQVALVDLGRACDSNSKAGYGSNRGMVIGPL